MPVHKVQLPNGQPLEVDAPDAATAMQKAQQYWAQHTDAKGAQQYSAATADAQANLKKMGGGGAWQNIVQSAMLGYGDELDAMGAANNVRMQNLGTYFGGKAPAYTPDQAYRAQYQVDNEALDAYKAQHPGKALATNIGGGFLTPGVGEMFGWAGSGAGIGGKVLRSGLVGSGVGAVAGAGYADDGHRLEGAAQGAAIGGGIGLVTPPLLGAAGSAVKALIPRRGATQALNMAAKDLALSGDGAAQRMAQNPDLTFAEATGKRGMSRARMLGRTDGLNTVIPDTLQERIDNTPNTINRGFEGATGIAPEDAEYTIDTLTKAGQKAARPLYKDAYSQTVDTPALRSVLQRPAVRKAMGPAAELLLNSDEAPHVTIDSMALPDALPTGDVQGDPTGYLSDVQALMGGGVRRASKAMGPSLSEHLAALGGLVDETGDITAFDGQKQVLNRGVGMLKKLMHPSGIPLDRAAEKAMEAGYFADVPSQTELLDALRNEAAGKPMVSMRAEGDPSRAKYLQGLDQRVTEMGLPDHATPKQIAQALADQDAYHQHLEDWAAGKFESASPVATQERVPSMQHLDYVKRHLDQQIAQAEKYGQTETAQSLRDARNALVRELKDNNPAYAKALDTSSDYLRNQEAFKSAPRQFKTGSNQAYENHIMGLSNAEKNAHLQGLLSDFNTRLNSKAGGPPSLSFLTSPNSRARLEIATRHLGPGVGEKIRTAILNAQEIRANAQAMIPPAEFKQLDPALAGALREAGIDRLPHSKHDALFMLGRAIAKLTSKAWTGARMQAAKPALEEYARLLMQNGTITMRDIAKMPPSPVRALLESVTAQGLRAVPGLTAGAVQPPPSVPSSVGGGGYSTGVNSMGGNVSMTQPSATPPRKSNRYVSKPNSVPMPSTAPIVPRSGPPRKIPYVGTPGKF
jgi:hypothetical protein